MTAATACFGVACLATVCIVAWVVAWAAVSIVEVCVDTRPEHEPWSD